LIDAIGWLATTLFAGSYFCKQQDHLRRLQAFAALVWVTYGVLLGAAPVIVANVIVATLALASTFRRTPVAEASPSA